MTPREMACIELVELLTDYLEGALPPDEAAAVEAHLATCPPCQVHLAQLQATIDALGRFRSRPCRKRRTTRCSPHFGIVSADQHDICPNVTGLSL